MPFFIPDLSAWVGNTPNFGAIAADPRMVGCIIKSSQGVGPGVSPQYGHSLTWFRDNWPRVRAAGDGFLKGFRYGTSWFRGCYHFGTPTSGGAAQADYMLSAIEKAGGWGEGDLPPAWDLEGDKWSSRQQVVDVSSAFAERIKQQLGRSPILYTGSTWRKFGVRESAGFEALWTTHMDLMAPFGWPNQRVMLHQYVGDGKYWNPASNPARLGYPTSVAGLNAKVDMNVVLDGGVPATSIERVRAILTSRNGMPAPAGRPGLPAPAGQHAAPAPLGQPIRRRSSIPIPLVVGLGAGLLTLGIMIARSGRDELV